MANDAKIISFDGEKNWTNWHRSVLKDPIAGRSEIHNPATSPGWAGLRKTAAAVQGLIGESLAKGRKLHAVGGRWSFSKVASPSGGRLVETATANWRMKPDSDSISPAYNGDPDELVLLQCGISVSEVNKWLEKGLGRSLRTTGASNGQTFAGAMSTSTHGSAVDIGAIQSQVCGIQLLTATSNLWLERRGEPVASPKLLQNLGATLANDPPLFDAALVGLGGLGIIHSVMVRTTGLFHLAAYQQPMPYDDTLHRAMNTMDFTGLNLPEPTRRPYFFQVAVNPNDNRNIGYVKVMYKRPFPPGTVIDYSIDGKFGVGHDLPGLVAKLVETVPGLTGAITNAVADGELKTFANQVGTWGQTFNYNNPAQDTGGAALAVPCQFSVDVMRMAIEAYKAHGPAPLVFACRYVFKSPGLLAWQQYDRNSVLDIDGLPTKRALKVMEAIWTRLDKEGMPYSQHWGKLHGLTKKRVEKSYGGKLQQWRAARDILLPTVQERQMFTNDLMESIGLGA